MGTLSKRVRILTCAGDVLCCAGKKHQNASHFCDIIPSSLILCRKKAIQMPKLTIILINGSNRTGNEMRTRRHGVSPSKKKRTIIMIVVVTKMEMRTRRYGVSSAGSCAAGRAVQIPRLVRGLKSNSKSKYQNIHVHICSWLRSTRTAFYG